MARFLKFVFASPYTKYLKGSKYPNIMGVLWGLLLLFFSCQSAYGPENQANIEKFLRAGQYAAAAETHQNYQELYKSQDELLFYINQSNLEYYRSIVPKPIDNAKNAYPLERAEEILRLNDNQQNSFHKQANSNPSQFYTASLQESLWQNIFASLYYWNNNSLEGALVELRRNHQKVKLYQQYADNTGIFKQKNQQLNFRNSALMQYLGMIYYREDRRFDDWRINRDALKKLTDTSGYYHSIPKKYLPTGTVHENSNNINFIIFTGAGVYKDAEGIRILKIPGGVAVQMDNANTKAELGFDTILIPALNTNFSYYEMMVPVMLERENRVNRILVRIDQKQQQELYPLEPFSKIRMELFRRLRADFLPKQITAFILKVIASEAVQTGLQNNSLAQLVAGLVGSAIVSSPSPDLRTADFYPSVGWVGEIQISPGHHDIELLYYSNGTLLNRKFIEISTKKGKNQIVQDYYPR